jgi:hypothetical protein
MINDEKPIVNKVAGSTTLMTLDLEEFLPRVSRVPFDIKPFLFKELILKEQEFRQALKNVQWVDYQDKAVYIFCSSDAIVPFWAYLLIAAYLQPHTSLYCFGNERQLIAKLIIDNIQSADLEVYRNKKLLIKGCSDNGIGEGVYVEAARLLLPYVSSLMYGEACSNVPIVKSGKIS